MLLISTTCFPWWIGSCGQKAPSALASRGFFCVGTFRTKREAEESGAGQLLKELSASAWHHHNVRKSKLRRHANDDRNLWRWPGPRESGPSSTTFATTFLVGYLGILEMSCNILNKIMNMCSPFFWIPKFEAPSGDKYTCFWLQKSNPCLILFNVAAEDVTKKRCQGEHPRVFFEADFCVAGVVWCCLVFLFWPLTMAGLTLSEATLGEMFFLWPAMGIVGRVGVNWSGFNQQKNNQPENRNQNESSKRSLYVTSGSFLFANTTVFGIAKWMTMNFGRPEIFTLFGIDVTGSLPKKPVAIWVVRTFPPCGSEIWRNFE